MSKCDQCRKVPTGGLVKRFLGGLPLMMCLPCWTGLVARLDAEASR